MARQRSFVAAAVAVALACVALGPIAGANAGHDWVGTESHAHVVDSYNTPGYYGPWSGGESTCPSAMNDVREGSRNVRRRAGGLRPVADLGKHLASK